jgi:alpha-N-acetylglucosamine transferase
VLFLDSDSMILQNMDDLFLLPPSRIAMPRAYWLVGNHQRQLSSQLMLIQPSATEFQRIMDRVDVSGPDTYDVDIIDSLYRDSAMVLPHRPYGMLTGEFRRRDNDHSRYLGSDAEEWDPVAELQRAKYVHFSDWPVPKPWDLDSDIDEARREMQPACVKVNATEDCRSREIWNGFYNTFKTRRKVRILTLSVT